MSLGPREQQLRDQREADYEARQIKPRSRTRSVTRHETATRNPPAATRNPPVSRNGRPSLGDQAMTNAERQRRKRQAKAQRALSEARP